MTRFEKIFEILMHQLVLIAVIIIWTLVVSASLGWNIYHANRTTIEYATNEAIIHFKMDMAFGEWAAKNGGVYVPVSEDTKPSRFLSHLPERDLETPSGKILTLMNPAYMLRHFQDESPPGGNSYSSITSLKPLNPENKPDQWQKAALLSFESGISEAFTIGEFKGKTCIRFIKPVFTDKMCLKCHESQGYNEGDIRGGISVSVPLYSYQNITNDEVRHFYLTHGFIWLLGIVGIFRGWTGLHRHNVEKLRIFKKLEKSERRTRYLNSQLLNAHEIERKRIAIEVHDEIGQIIIATKYIVENAIVKIKNDNLKEVDRNLTKAVSILQKVIDRVRNLEKNLVPPLLKDLGLLVTISSFCRDFEKEYSDIKVKIIFGTEEENIPLYLKTTIFRIIQETFGNIARHSTADLITLVIKKTGMGIKLSITDNGRGFDPDSIDEEFPSFKGLGLSGIRERTEFSGGNFDIRSGPGLGTGISCVWPY